MKRPSGRLLAILGGSVLVLVMVARFLVCHDFRSGWAEHHADYAVQLRKEAANQNLAAADLKEHLIAADLHELVAAKYRHAAIRPWVKFDGPMVDKWEMQEATDRVQRRLRK